MDDKITESKLDRYFKISREAYDAAVSAPMAGKVSAFSDERQDFLDMVKRYMDDALHFREKGDFVNAFAALSYAHGWLDAGARLGLWDVHDSRLFTVD